MCSTSMTSSNAHLSSPESLQMRTLRFRHYITCPSQLKSHFKPPLPTTLPQCFPQDGMGPPKPPKGALILGGACQPLPLSKPSRTLSSALHATLVRFPGRTVWRASLSAWLGSCLGSFNLSRAEMTGNGRVLVSPDKKPGRLDESERTSCLPL